MRSRCVPGAFPVCSRCVPGVFTVCSRCSPDGFSLAFALLRLWFVAVRRHALAPLSTKRRVHAVDELSLAVAVIRRARAVDDPLLGHVLEALHVQQHVALDLRLERERDTKAKENLTAASTRTGPGDDGCGSGRGVGAGVIKTRSGDPREIDESRLGTGADAAGNAAGGGRERSGWRVRRTKLKKS